LGWDEASAGDECFAAGGQDVVGDVEVEETVGDIDDDGVAVFDEGDDAAGGSLGVRCVRWTGRRCPRRSDRR